jgi:putative OPT family oligopeptide transporter
VSALSYNPVEPPAAPSADATGSPAAAAVVPRAITARALLMGCAIGVVLAAGNVYTGIKTSFIDGGSITAALLGFTFFATFKRLSRRPYAALENNITQTTAASAAIMGFVLGISGPIPALSMMGHDYPGWAIFAWGASLGLIGILMAASLRRKLILGEALPFPTGTATAEVIETIYAARQTAVRRARLLVASAVLAMAFTWLRDARPHLIPQVTTFGTTLAGVSTVALTLGFSWSPLMVSTGLIMGVRSSVSMLIGSVVTWVVLAPWLLRSRIVTSASFGGCVSWLVWPALGLLMAGSFLPLLLDWRAVLRSFRDLLLLLRRRASGPDDAGDRFRHAKPIVLVCTGVMVWVGWTVFKLHPLVTIVTLLLAVVLANVSARTAGETDFAPIGAIGMLTQLIFAGYGPVVSLLSGSIAAGGASQTAQTLWALKAGHRLNASATSQLWAQILGALLGGLVVVPVYFIISRTYGLGTEAMPAVAALSWKATAEAVRGGLAAMPQYGPAAGAAGLCLGVLLTALSRTRVGRFVPSPAAMGVAVLFPASLSFAAFVGGVMVLIIRRIRPQSAESSIMSIAAGGMAGESVMGVIIAILMASGLL